MRLRIILILLLLVLLLVLLYPTPINGPGISMRWQTGSPAR